ncbi:MAG: hypothetical protein MJY72_02435 [Bacteroidales bacterium]|nr:hypothetical protein [Bacteroidales bacterium]
MVILYVHGMGGGSDSRIPRLLREWFSERPEYASVEVVCRTYDFDPDIAYRQLESWVEELSPKLIVGESLGSCNALRIRRSDIPYIFVSPALNAPLFMGYLAFLALVPGVTSLLDRIYRPRPGDRQPLHFTFRTMRKYRRLRHDILQCGDGAGRMDVHAYFGEHDHYRRTGVVSVRAWERQFGPGTYTLYNGTHFMEEEFVRSLLIPKILLTLRAH